MFSRLILCILLVFCFPITTFAKNTTPLRIVVSIAPQKYMLERIAGDAVQIAVLVSPGADPHNYEPGPATMRSVFNSSAWFTIGIPFEDIWLERMHKLSPELAIISSVKGITRVPFHMIANLELADKERERTRPHDNKLTDYQDGHSPPASNEMPANGAVHPVDDHAGHGHSHESLDPHVWLSPMLVREMLPNLARELGKLLPDKAQEFRANAQVFANELEALDNELANRFRAVPVEKRVFLTFHPSWQYFALNYQLRELSIEIDGKEPGPKGMKAVIDVAKQYGITTVFIEPQFSKTAAKAIAQNIGAEVVEADPLAEDLPALYRNMTEKLIESFPQ